MLDGAKPQPPQTFKPAAFLTWVQKQQALAHELLHGRRESNRWWHPARWARLEEELAGWLVERLKVFREVILAVDLSVR